MKVKKMKLTYVIKQTDSYNNIKSVLQNEFKLSKRLILKLKTNQKIFLNSTPEYVTKQVKPNDLIEVIIEFEEKSENIIATQMDLDIIYEDEAYLVINKPAKIETHPTCANYTNTLSNGVKFYFNSIGLKRKIRPINRLDKDTSGLIIFAKNEYIQESLIQQMKYQMFQKEYIAVLEGIVKPSHGVINAPIRRKEESIIERCVAKDGDIAITEYQVIKTNNNLSIIKFVLKTGRTHQIRVHSKYIGHPIVGDFLYGKRSNMIQRQALHSYKTKFFHPITKQIVQYVAPIPEDMAVLIEYK